MNVQRSSSAAFPSTSKFAHSETKDSRGHLRCSERIGSKPSYRVFPITTSTTSTSQMEADYTGKYCEHQLLPVDKSIHTQHGPADVAWIDKQESLEVSVSPATVDRCYVQELVRPDNSTSASTSDPDNRLLKLAGLDSSTQSTTQRCSELLSLPGLFARNGVKLSKQRAAHGSQRSGSPSAGHKPPIPELAADVSLDINIDQVEKPKHTRTKWLNGSNRKPNAWEPTVPTHAERQEDLPKSTPMAPSCSRAGSPRASGPCISTSSSGSDSETLSTVPQTAAHAGCSPPFAPALSGSLQCTLTDLIVQKRMLQEQYISLRAERALLLESINVALSKLKHRPENVAVVCNRVSSLSTLAVSVDICFYRLKATYFRQDAAVEDLLFRIRSGSVAIVDVIESKPS